MIEMLSRRDWSLAVLVLFLLFDRSFSAQTSLPRNLFQDRHQNGDERSRATTDSSNPRIPSRATEAAAPGEDIGAGRAVRNPLLLVAQRMREAERRIKNKDTSTSTQTLQRRAVADLTKMIEQLQKKSSSQASGSKPSTSPSASPDRSQSDPNAAGTQATQDGQASLNQNHQVEITGRSARQVIRNTWGHLPATLRESVLNAEFERFLPKYERLIETYYERLAEEEPR